MAATAAVAQTRLDRLVTLLSSGSTPAIRATAARQLGQIAAVRVRSGEQARGRQHITQQQQAQQIPSVKTEEDDDDEDKKWINTTDSSDTTAQPANTRTIDDSTSTYRGIEGDWDQAIFLLARVLPHLRSKTWDTRVAAAQAIEAICSASGIWDPDVKHEDAYIQTQSTEAGPSSNNSEASLLSFDNFSLSNVFLTGKKLLASAGNEYDLPTFSSVEERLAHAKRDMQRLGLGSMAGVDVDLGVDMEKELLGGETQQHQGEQSGSVPKSGTQTPASSTVEDVTPQIAPEEVDMSKLSARERNQLKRKRKLEGKSGPQPSPKIRVVEDQSNAQGGATSIKTPTNGSGDYLTAGNKSSLQATSPGGEQGALSPGGAAIASAADATSLVVKSDQWPFTLVCALLLSDLFSPKWEVRHGAALGLRELLKLQGCSGGKMLGYTQQDEMQIDRKPITNTQRHLQWSEDIAVRLLCVLTLDRLGDFVFDQVIAPVRETTGQALASLMKWMEIGSITKAHSVLLEMIRQDFLLDGKSSQAESSALKAKRGVKGYAWEVRHAGLLGLRYEVTVRKDVLQSGGILEDVTKLAIICLRDDDDDVRSVAAATLLPIVDQIVERMPGNVPVLLDQLWNSLILLKDDLSSSTAGVMDLLTKLVEKPKVVAEHLTKDQESARIVVELIPRLYPFFRHTIVSVRLAVLNALLTFLSNPAMPTSWIDERLVRLAYQNLIVEERVSIREASLKVWTSSLAIIVKNGKVEKTIEPHIAKFFTILMTPLGTPIDFALFYKAPNAFTSREQHNVDKDILTQDLALVGVDTVIRGRLGAAKVLGSILAVSHEAAGSSTFGPALLDYLGSTSALQKCLASVVVQEWAEHLTRENTKPKKEHDQSFDMLQHSPLAKDVHDKLLNILESPAPSTYAEMVVMLQRIQRQSQGLYTAFERDGKVKKDRVPTLPSQVDPTGQLRDGFSIDTAKSVVSTGFEGLSKHISAKVKNAVQPALDDRRAKIITEIGFYQSIKDRQDNQVMASAAGAVIAIGALPAKLNPVIRSVMNSVKFEENADLQRRSAYAIANLIKLCQKPDARSNPSEKIVKNLCAFVCQDTTRTPVFDQAKQTLIGIYSLLKEREAQAALAATGGPGRGKSKAAILAALPDSDVNLTEEEREGRNIRRGAEFALLEICNQFGDQLFDSLPTLWQSMTGSLIDTFNAPQGDVVDAEGQAVIDCCAIIQVVVPHLPNTAHSRVTSQILPSLTQAIKSKYSVIRSNAAKTLTILADCMLQDVMLHVVKFILPLLSDSSNASYRQGAAELISFIVDQLDLKILPYVIVLIVPILGRMSDPDEDVRLMATNTFASLIKMVPLEAGLPDPPGLPEELMTKRQDERQFLSQLLDGTKVESYTLPVPIKADLRKYQMEGVSWMAFLAKFQLHGALCDDMGLGKTLQSICILSSKHFERAQLGEGSQSSTSRKLPSLIVCPPTLTGHWCHEIKQYATNLKPLLYAGQPAERAKLQKQIHSHDCIVTSYDTVRNDIDFLSKIEWLYCILDEGHVIKSAKTKTTKAVKQIRAEHRLILSGTPIQNNVLELWSLFDFLMPGFLGTEKQFMERYGRPILASRDAKVTAKEHERASLALESLHKQVLPFLLRRMKEDVLADLPPKIIQDIGCEMSVVQKQLYDEYMRQQKSEEFDDSNLEREGASQEKQHIFQTLQYLRKLVCHPSMVFNRSNARHKEIEQALIRSGKSLNDIENAPKLLALKQLLQDCGIGGAEQVTNSQDALTAGLDDADSAGISQHRVLIFCQQRQMLDIIEKDLFQKDMKSVTFTRLDGTVSSDKRFEIVQRFNSDPSIDVLLLTTSVGGLGLTLTGADTVIFVEHDWNPMKDMQAMDRAHRLGQKKVVNVYRLITKDTLEEQIMGLQRFKLNVAGNIVNQQNKAMDSMETDQILDLFNADSGDDQKNSADPNAAKGKGGLSQKALLASLEAMPDTGDDYAGLQDWSAS
ncbi:uncharacterized protein FA14DRAFT_93569 [Meira miltonrushii]|uniref:Uncharacterized protein n=1 Tax=Meira miltonrushii TaxID=1280837 RepID=A0A316V8M5_9BASI|nr:uncharacterized protein FA14DRAFT_93569 [Meira miltonrushii]PWN31835.1 hypothetical protein FA14DRAFT_93569 [Meira miltonrushii]